MFPNNEYYIKEYIETRGLKITTYKLMKAILTHYSKYQQLTLHELLLEADAEEEKRIRWKHRTLKKRLINYMNHCKKTMKLTSAKAYFKKVKSFYTHHEIEIGILPRWNNKNANVSEPITIDDIPTNEMIKKAVEISNPLMKSLILFLSSSGMSKIDCLNLSIKDFLESTYQYHKSENIDDALEILSNEKNIIPVFKLRRSKTNKYFITFCTPEATQKIVYYLKLRNERNRKYNRRLLDVDDKLFKISAVHYHVKFIELNKLLGLKKKGSFYPFRGHMLRKFHATKLEKGGMSRYLVNVLQGKSNNSVDDVYFFEDVEFLKKEYLSAMSELLIFNDSVLEKELLDLNNVKSDFELLVSRIEVLESFMSDAELELLDKFL